MINERLNRVVSGKLEYERMLARVEELEALATRVTPVLSMTPGGGSQLKDDTWAQLMDYKASLTDKIQQYLRDCDMLEHELECIRNPKIRTAMQYRYINGFLVEQIARAMNYDERNIYILLRKGKSIYADTYGGVDD